MKIIEPGRFILMLEKCIPTGIFSVDPHEVFKEDRDSAEDQRKRQ